MRASEILTDLELGSDVAESDEHLRRYFVETSVFQDVIHDETDLVLGPKGSGKTALFRMLSDPRFEIPALEDTDVLPAFNIQGTVFFQDLYSRRDSLTERSLRQLWAAYILSLAGNRFVADNPTSPFSPQIEAALRRAELFTLDSDTRLIWKSLVGTFRRLMDPKMLKGRLDIPGGAGFEAEAQYEPQSTSSKSLAPAWMSSDFDPDTLAQLVTDGLYGQFRRYWILFDRLDEAFQEDADLEKLALRALMRASADLSSYGPSVRVKLFLRTDVLDRITEDAGFVNITHLRSLKITWTRPHIRDMISKRLVESEYLKHYSLLVRQDPINALLASVDETPKRRRGSVGQGVKTGPLAYILEKTADASGEPNPRNVVSFLREAKSFELQRCSLNDRDLGAQESIVTQDSMVKAWRRISERRLTDTLFAEYNYLRSAVQKFRNGPQQFDGPYLADTVGLPMRSVEYDRLVSDLCYAGFLHLTGKRLYRIPDLYRPALGLNPKWEDRSRESSSDDLLLLGAPDPEREVPRRSRGRARRT
jgi:hypothetical protein